MQTKSFKTQEKLKNKKNTIHLHLKKKVNEVGLRAPGSSSHRNPKTKHNSSIDQEQGRGGEHCKGTIFFFYFFILYLGIICLVTNLQIHPKTVLPKLNLTASRNSNSPTVLRANK